MADRIGVIDKGELKLVEEKHALMARLGRTEARFTLAEPLRDIPAGLGEYKLALADDGRTLCYRGDGEQEHDEGVAGLVKALVREGVNFTGLSVSESSLEDIFVDLIGRNARSDGAREKA
jgi:ABC-2 type transport system ATP-binding protein